MRYGTGNSLRHLTTFAISLVLACGCRLAVADSNEDEIDFARDIRPILSNTCYKCHGPDEDSREAELRLDTEEGAYADLGGYQAISPGKPQASALIERIESTAPDERMPPSDSGLEVSPQQIALLKQWIAQGGKYDRHWAFRPIVRGEMPISMNRLGLNPVDAFVIHKLQAVGLTHAAAADRSTLIRRVHLDLLGLPPDQDALTTYFNDNRPGAYERMVDRVLANPHYGEKWGRHWLDQARYADTNGYTVDSERSMWPYRDWVINAINADLPFDQFTIEQLAGDLLPNPTQEQLVATGFHRNTLINQEGGTDREQFRNEAVVDRVNTTGAVWLGLTVGCAQCHTHKYDPLTQHEYYQLFAFFNSSQDVNSVSPTLSVASATQQAELAKLDSAVAKAKMAVAEYDSQQNEQAIDAEKNDGKPVQWTIVKATSAESEAGATLERLSDESWLASGTNSDADMYRITFASPLQRITAVRLEVLTHPSLPKGGPGRAGNGNFVLNEIALNTGQGNATWVHATADHSQKDYDVTAAIDGDEKTGWAINVASGNPNVKRTSTFVMKPIDSMEQLAVIELQFAENPAGYNIGRFRLSVTDAPHLKFALPDPERARLTANLKQAQDERARFAKRIPVTMVMRDLDKPRETNVLIRGDFLRKGDVVQANAPAFLPGMPTGRSTNSRLELAEWLVSDQHPLTARVTVNRAWAKLFGQGLVETENDFGLQGTPPTHPQLLDWLSSEFIVRGWSMKQLHRTIVTSATYRQSSHARPDAESVDSQNKLLSRQARLRVDAEIVRDLALSACGLLDNRIGGKSVYPPQPDGVYAFTQRNASWPTSKGSDRYRRGMYTFFMRSAPYPMLTTFDTPRFNTTCTQRVRSNTPLQSLTLANDQAMLEAARALGKRLLAEAEDDSTRIELAYQLCFARRPTEKEASSFSRFIKAQRQDFQSSPDEAKLLNVEIGSDVQQDVEHATWTIAARVLLNLDEFITRE